MNSPARNKYSLKTQIKPQMMGWPTCAGYKWDKKMMTNRKKGNNTHKGAGTSICLHLQQEVFSGVSFSLCAPNSRGICLNLDSASSSSLSCCCDDGGETLMDVCSPLCPSLELSAWWTRKNEMPCEICHIKTDCDMVSSLHYLWPLLTKSNMHTVSVMDFTPLSYVAI